MEIEIKAKIQGFNSVKKQLKKLGAVKLDLRHQVDTYYTPPDRDFSRLGLYFRTRYDILSGKARLEYHISVSDYVAHEYELGISDVEMMQKILKFLGYKILCVIDKEREEYKCGDFNIDLDKVKKLGNFIEVEIISGKVKGQRKRIEDFCQKIGIDSRSFIRHHSYLSMMLGLDKKYVYKK